MTGDQLIDFAQERLNELTDGTAALYTDAQAIGWLNEAQRMVSIARPDAKSAIKSMVLVEGVLQSLEAGDRRLMGVTTNMGADGLEASRGDAIDGPVDFNRLGRFKRNWASPVNASPTVLEYVYNPETPTRFYVNPPVPAGGVWIEVIVAQEPTDLATGADSIDVLDIYTPALIEWILYCFWGRDDERSPNFARAERAKACFFEILGAKTQADAAVAPAALEIAG